MNTSSVKPGASNEEDDSIAILASYGIFFIHENDEDAIPLPMPQAPSPKPDSTPAPGFQNAASNLTDPTNLNNLPKIEKYSELYQYTTPLNNEIKVFEDDLKSSYRVYTRASRVKWICDGCNKTDEKPELVAYFQGDKFCVPPTHLCQPIASDQRESPETIELPNFSSPIPGGEKNLQRMDSNSLEEDISGLDPDFHSLSNPRSFPTARRTRSVTNDNSRLSMLSPKLEVFVNEPPSEFIQIHAGDYRYGYDENGIPRKRLIINAESSSNVHEYSQLSNKSWACIGCLGKTKNSTLAKFFDGELYVDPKHNCEAIPDELSRKTQEDFRALNVAACRSTPMATPQNARTPISKSSLSEGQTSSIRRSPRYSNQSTANSTPVKKSDLPRTPSGRFKALSQSHTELHPSKNPLLRKVDPEDIEFGDSHSRENNRMFVPELDNRESFREYYQFHNHWRCLNCQNQHRQKVCGAVDRENNIYVPIDSQHKCEPISASELEKKREAASRSQSQKRKEGAWIRQFLKKQKIGDSALPSDKEAVENSEVNEKDVASSEVSEGDASSSRDQAGNLQSRSSSRSDDEIQFIEAKFNAPPKASQIAVKPSGSVSKENIKSQSNDDLNTSNSDAAPSSSSVADKIEVFRPSHFSIQQWKSKLGLSEYPEKQALKFWLDIDTPYIVSESQPETLHALTANSTADESGYRCLSLFLTGSEAYHAKIKESIKEKFYKDFKTMGRCLGADFRTMAFESPLIMNSILQPPLNNVLCQFAAQHLGIRIGVFENGVLQRYGDWSEARCRTDIPTCLMSLQNGFYQIVLTVSNL